VSNGQVPDVLVAFPNGRPFAFEVRYAPLTIDACRARYEGYRAQGIVDIWLFGHIPPHLRVARGQPGATPRFIFSQLLEAVELAGGIAHWVDPDERAIRMQRHAVDSQRVRSPSAGWPLVEAPPEPLEASQLDQDGLCAPADTAQAHWHPRLFDEVIQGRVGRTFTYRRAVAPFLGSPTARPRAVYRALSAYLERLRRAGYLDY